MIIRHKGRVAQTFIYLGKLLRMFVFQNDWKVLPLAAFIAGLVAYVTGANLFVTMEGTLLGSFALSCVCIWNGFFNSIQVICRERAILKREHRAGLHITSYVCAHMLYQAALCLAQAYITIEVSKVVGSHFPEKGVFFGSFETELLFTLFLITYAADMMALMVSAIAHSTTAAMTVMPFLLILQLVFSGAVFSIEGPAAGIKNLMISRWGIVSLCTMGDYNARPMVSIWNSMMKMKNVELIEGHTVNEILVELQESGKKDEILYETAKQNQVVDYVPTIENLSKSWNALIVFAIVFAAATVFFLEFIDKDRRS